MQRGHSDGRSCRKSVVQQVNALVYLNHSTARGSLNDAAFEQLRAQLKMIEQEFGYSLEWQDLPDGEGSQIRKVIRGGYSSPVEEWAEIQKQLVDAMIGTRPISSSKRQLCLELGFRHKF